MIKPLLNAFVAYALCAGALVGYASWYAVVEEKSAVVARLEDQITIKTEAASRVASARASLTEIESDETQIRSYFVSEAGVVAFIDGLEARGQEFGAAIDVLSVSMSNEKTDPTLLFTIAVEGDFSAVMRTVGVIEFSPHALLISNLSLRRSATSGWRADLDFRVSAKPALAV